MADTTTTQMAKPSRARDARPPVDPDLVRLGAWLRPLASPTRLSLLRFLTQPRYLEEVASHLQVSRQGARKHLDKLVRIGVLERRPAMRATGPVTEYLVRPEALFLIYDEFEKLSSLRALGEARVQAPTLSTHGPATSPPATGPALYVMHGLRSGQRFALDLRGSEEWTMGRSARCKLVVDYDPYASTRHAAVRRAAGGFVLVDLGSTNGTQHNWVTIPKGGERPLRHGDVVGVGKTLLLFWDSARP
ncbi:MAG TPA: FHA domain-containing protein [Candidatus Thermoplasmatota archaeon]|jgi:hypothetical protein|nr:FHA domain-containing protein [Candidatus Thermoplasmatota archaeon]